MRDGDVLHGRDGRSYPIYEGIPVLVRDDMPSTLWVSDASRRFAQEVGEREDPFAIATIALTFEEREWIRRAMQEPERKCDPVIDALVAATNGILYRPLARQAEPPVIPKLPEFPTAGPILDVGCSWGRWTISGAEQGRQVVGMDPSLGAVLAGRREADRRGIGAHCAWVVADARFLPLASGTFGGVWSYSVLQHFSVSNATAALAEFARVLAPGGTARVQMASRNGLRSTWHRLRRRSEPSEFDVRYWAPRTMLDAARSFFDDASIEAEGFLGLGMRIEDAPRFTGWRRLALRMSHRLVGLARRFPVLAAVADSVYVHGCARARGSSR